MPFLYIFMYFKVEFYQPMQLSSLHFFRKVVCEKAPHPAVASEGAELAIQGTPNDQNYTFIIPVVAKRRSKDRKIAKQ